MSRHSFSRATQRLMVPVSSLRKDFSHPLSFSYFEQQRLLKSRTTIEDQIRDFCQTVEFQTLLRQQFQQYLREDPQLHQLFQQCRHQLAADLDDQARQVLQNIAQEDQYHQAYQQALQEQITQSCLILPIFLAGGFLTIVGTLSLGYHLRA